MVGMISSAVQASIIYRQNFEYSDSSTNGDPAVISGWQFNGGPSGSLLPVPEGGLFGANSNGNVPASYVGPNVNSSPEASEKTAYGFAFTGNETSGTNTSTTNSVLLSTTQYQPDLSSVGTIDWYNSERYDGTSGLHSTQRLAVEVGNQWYASAFVATDSTTWTNYVVDVKSTGWIPFNFVSGTALDQTISGTSVSLPTSGTLQSFGVYISLHGIDGTGGYWARADDYTIQTPVPEPASLAILGAGGLLILRRRR